MNRENANETLEVNIMKWPYLGYIYGEGENRYSKDWERYYQDKEINS